MAKRPSVQDSLTLLLPAYVPRVEMLLEAMSRRDMKPRLFETYRTEERCMWAFRKKASKSGLRSMHRYRAAVDIIHEDFLWSHPPFFKALGEEAAKLRLTWGGDWDSNPATPQSFDDRPHVQAIPLWKQQAFRDLPTDAERNSFLIRFFIARPPR